MAIFRHQFGYLFAEAFRGLRRSPLSSFTAVFTIGICTSALGIILAISLLLADKTSLLTGHFDIRAFVHSDFESEKALDEIRSAIMAISDLDSIRFVSKSEALEEFRKDFDNTMTDVLTFNPLPPSYIIYPGNYYSSSGPSRQLHEKLSRIKGIEAVSEAPPYLAWVDKWLWFSLGLGAFLLAFISGAIALIISNTVKLNLYARRELVDNMKYCGAGTLFIMLPFLLEGLLLGIAGSLVGVLSVVLFNLLVPLLFPGFSLNNQFQVCMILLFFTAFLSTWSSVTTVRKFIYAS